MIIDKDYSNLKIYCTMDLVDELSNFNCTVILYNIQYTVLILCQLQRERERERVQQYEPASQSGRAAQCLLYCTVSGGESCPDTAEQQSSPRIQQQTDAIPWNTEKHSLPVLNQEPHQSQCSKHQQNGPDQAV